MKRTLLLLMALLTLCGSGAWATDYTIFDQSSNSFYDGYGTRNTTKLWTSGSVAGIAGFSISLNGSNVTLDKAGNWALVVHSSADETSYTMTLHAPVGYKITGYSLIAQVYSSSYPNSYTLTAVNGTTKTINSTTQQTLTVSGLDSRTTDIAIVAAAATETTQRWLTMESLVVTLEEDANAYFYLRFKGTDYFITNGFTSNVGPVRLKVTKTGETDLDGVPTYTIQRASDGYYAVYSAASKSTGDSDVKLSWSETASNNTFTITAAGTDSYVRIKPAKTASDQTLTDTYWTAWNTGAGNNIVFWSATDDLSNWTLEPTTAYDSDGNALEDGASYRITLRGATNALYLNGTAIGVQAYTGSDAQIWVAKLNSDGTYQFKAPADGTYWTVSEYAEGAAKVTANAAAASATSWDLIKVGEQYNITSVSGSTRYYFSNYGGVSNNMGFYNSNTTTDGGSLFTFSKVQNVSYRCETLAGTVLATGSGYYSANTTNAPAISNYTASSATEEDGTIIYKYSLTGGLPFYTSPAPTNTDGTLTFGDNTIWYVLRMHTYPDSQKYWQKGETGINGTDSYNVTSNDYLWCFVGDESTGFQVYNRNGKAVSFVTGGSADVSGVTPSIFEVRPSAATSGTYALWLLGAEAESRSYLNMNGGVKSWNAADQGSSFYSIEAAASIVLSNVSVQNRVGGYAIADAKAVTDAFSTFNSSMTEANFQNLLDTYSSKSLIALADGYYRLQNVDTSRAGYVGVNSDKTYLADVKTTPLLNATTVWKIADAGDGKWSLFNPATGKFCGTIPTYSGTNVQVPTSDEAVGLTFTAKTATQYFITSDGSCSLNDDTVQDGNIYSYSDENASRWYLIPATLNEITMISPSGVTDEDAKVYMTYANNTGASVQMPADVKVYKVTGGTKSDVSLTETTQVVPSGKGVILETTKGATIPLLPTNGTADLDDNVLVAGTGASVSNGYLLAYKKGETEAKFYLLDDFTLASDKAYLPADALTEAAGVKELRLNLGGTETAVEEITNGKSSNGKWFNLAGQRVEKATRGLYIVNGKKVLVK